MDSQFAILPAAVTMVAGPQIISAVVLATSRDVKRNSLAFLAGVAAAITLGTFVVYTVMKALGGGEGSSGSGRGQAIEYALVALLVVGIVHAWLTRKTAEPPKWLTGLQEAVPRKALTLGFLLFLLMPTDVMMMLSAGSFLAQKGYRFIDAWPFLLATMLLISLPLLAYLVLGDRAEAALPKVRDWMNANSWLINIGIYLFFIYTFLS